MLAERVRTWLIWRFTIEIGDSSEWSAASCPENQLGAARSKSRILDGS